MRISVLTVFACFAAAVRGPARCWAARSPGYQNKPGPLPPPPNGTILAEFCGGDYSGKCGGGMGNWWSPTIAQLGDGTLVVAAEGKSHRSNAHATPTFNVLWRSTDHGASFGPAVPLLNESGTTVYGGATLVYSVKSATLRVLYTVDTSSGCQPACGAGNLSVLVSTAAGVAGSWTAAGLAAGADGQHFPSSGQVNSGVQLRHGPHRGRLVVPRELFFGSKPARWPTPGGFQNQAGVIFSDNEQTWTAGAMLPPPFREEETAIAELANGSLVITARNGQNHSSSSLCVDGSGEVCRVFARSDNGGMNWRKTWHVPYSMLPASRCEAAMASVDLPGHATGLLLFGAPMNTTTGDRTNYTVHTSLDGGMTWAWATALYPSTPAAVAWTGYSAITAIGEPQRVSTQTWRLDIGAAFQLGHNLGRHVEGGGYDMAWARRSIEVVGY